MKNITRLLAPLYALLFLLLPSFGMADDIQRFAGTYTGFAEITVDGNVLKRDMSVTIEPTKDAFELSWTSVTYRADGRVKKQTYTIDFVPSARDNIFQSAMKKNLFGKSTPLDPLQGEPFVWARFVGDTFSVFSLFINEIGDYEMQEFHRTLVDDGLELVFRRVHNGVPEREITTKLMREE
ncbi:MAG: hypothetical protein P8N14_08030 [Sulfitobacter sp.]|jgi:hypothetical protein|nr:hypothetical protein [Sulfitobacter sp.]